MPLDFLFELVIGFETKIAAGETAERKGIVLGVPHCDGLALVCVPVARHDRRLHNQSSQRTLECLLVLWGLGPSPGCRSFGRFGLCIVGFFVCSGLAWFSISLA